jgi:hypothetical protein
MLTIPQLEEKGNQMASAPIPNPGLCSPAAMEGDCLYTASGGPQPFPEVGAKAPEAGVGGRWN